MSVRHQVVVSFARNGRSQAKSFPRKRESRLQAIGNAPPTDWIPAFAGMTGASKAMRFQLTPLPRHQDHPAFARWSGSKPGRARRSYGLGLVAGGFVAGGLVGAAAFGG